MIRVTISHNDVGFSSINICGHDLRTATEESPLCLAVSVLSRTVTRYLEKHKLIEEIVVHDGYLHWRIRDPLNPQLIIAMEILLQGIEDLTSEWQERITINFNKE
ncbi:ribosomal-processing cysteine protease Prp [Entomospira culicis]|uniref:Ribosomal processing cysteine protease Prp n=1 Tax=Entomospira culicis TaxID=2719989 RepID=A0A968KX01_9SPIO|nr:ribosomal-processing cysteine protease Prp [Entomospira culicis]NIZ19278.1 ribosomal-processing cysteine protease Prp [Entomospira culicis]NIZ69817.1 ribosomal-processing cysteine protease Prp [Entomospira culicis]WDI36924.1 ribosomal-processing cysteine protease Prp [Entomospira culicis]WDI38553.1 ribosomal-processing cysteine protease Prp [Entomospira culicis]